jgi:uncharacterized protein involved in exopolysaccharide biosynthesis
MEEEIDLRLYIAILIKNWLWIVGLSLITALVAFIISHFSTPKYEAIALAAITPPRLSFEFTPDIRTQNLLPNYQAFPKLANSDDLLKNLLEVLETEGITWDANATPFTFQSLKALLTAASSSDPSLIELKVKFKDPQKAAQIANLWVNTYVAQASRIYGQSEKEKDLFIRQLAQVETELKDIETNLVKISGETGQGLLSQDLLKEPLNSGSTFDLRPAETKAYVDFGLLGLQVQIAANDLVSNQTRQDKLEALLTQAKALQTLVDENKTNETAAVLSLQIELAQLTSQETPVDLTIEFNFAENSSFNLEDIIAIIESNLATTKASAEQTTLELTQLQGHMATQRQTFDNLLRQYILKRELYLSLVRKVTEDEIDDGQTDPVRLASYASVPQQPISPRPLINTIIGGFMGLVISVSAIFFWHWWTEPSPAPKSD